MAIQEDDVESVNTRLTKCDVAPTKVKDSNNISTLTGNTRESKAKAYAVAETKKVSLQYVDTINGLNGKLKENLEREGACRRYLLVRVSGIGSGFYFAI